MKHRLSWHKARRIRCFNRWMRAGCPVPNHVMDATAFRPYFEPWRVRVKLRQKAMRYRRETDEQVTERRAAIDKAQRV